MEAKEFDVKRAVVTINEGDPEFTKRRVAVKKILSGIVGESGTENKMS